MPIIFPFTDFGTILATSIFFVCLIYCGLPGIHLDGEKNKRGRNNPESSLWESAEPSV